MTPWQQWLIDNGLQVATLIAVAVLFHRVSRWSGIVDTQIKNLNGWMQGHMERHHGGDG